MSLQKKHWMVTLQEVFYPALAAVGLPCKYRMAASVELLVDLKPNIFYGIKNLNHYRYLLILALLLFLSQHRYLSDHFEEKLHAVQVKFPLPYGNFCGRQPCPDLHRGH